MKVNWINSREEFIALRKEWGLRDDWHEPDEQGVDVTTWEGTFDNAHCDERESHIILHREDETEVHAVNLALLCAWASEDNATLKARIEELKEVAERDYIENLNLRRKLAGLTKHTEKDRLGGELHDDRPAAPRRRLVKIYELREEE